MDSILCPKFPTHWLPKMKPNISTIPTTNILLFNMYPMKKCISPIKNPQSLTSLHHVPFIFHHKIHIFRLSFRPSAPALADLACPAPRSAVARRKLLQSGCPERDMATPMATPKWGYLMDKPWQTYMFMNHWSNQMDLYNIYVFKKCVFWHQHHLETTGSRITNRILSQDHIIGQNSAPWQCVVVPPLAALALVAVMSTKFSIRYIMIYLLFDARSVR